MPLYTRRQLVLLLLLLVAAGGGLAVGRWRQAHPELADRLEHLEGEPDVPAPAPDRGAPARLPREASPRIARSPKLSPVTPAAAVDVNRASEDELRRLPGVGPVLAARIAQARATEGPFKSIDDLRSVRGLGQARLDRLRALLAVGDEAPPRDPDAGGPP